jgi:hypothetical protein
VRHGQLLIKSAGDCQRCHHVGPGRDQCATCHDAASLGRAALETQQSFRIAADQATVTRRLPFAHQRHSSVACLHCHTSPVSRAPEGAQCGACHVNHHTGTANCVACHSGANALARHAVSDHASCASANCHGARAANLPASREMCLMCHTAQTRHAPGKICEQCHRVLARGTN